MDEHDDERDKPKSSRDEMARDLEEKYRDILNAPIPKSLKRLIEKLREQESE